MPLSLSRTSGRYDSRSDVSVRANQALDRAYHPGHLECIYYDYVYQLYHEVCFSGSHVPPSVILALQQSCLGIIKIPNMIIAPGLNSAGRRRAVQSAPGVPRVERHVVLRRRGVYTCASPRRRVDVLGHKVLWAPVQTHAPAAGVATPP